VLTAHFYHVFLELRNYSRPLLILAKCRHRNPPRSAPNEGIKYRVYQKRERLLFFNKSFQNVSQQKLVLLDLSVTRSAA